MEHLLPNCHFTHPANTDPLVFIWTRVSNQSVNELCMMFAFLSLCFCFDRPCLSASFHLFWGAALVLILYCAVTVLEVVFSFFFFCWKQMSAVSGKDADVSNGSAPELLSFMRLNKCGQFVIWNGTFYITSCTIYNINNLWTAVGI